IDFEIVPPSVNSAPVCEGDRAEQRTDGSEPVELFLHPRCHDPDDDEFVVDGAGPGEHTDAPLEVEAGDGMANWHYRTGTASGPETATIWATDVLDARSADATLEVDVGPDVDELAACHPSTYSTPFGWRNPVYSRPGAIRRFSIYCEDVDGDPFVPLPTALPQRGALALLELGVPRDTAWGREQWIGAQYVPTGDDTEPDPFTVTPKSERGDGFGDMEIVPRALPANGGGGCGWWSPMSTYENTPITLPIGCDDDDGDPLTATVVGEPLHGTTGPVVVTPGAYEGASIHVPYVPEPGYTGYDCVKIFVTDGYGLDFEITYDITVREGVVSTPDPPIDPPPVPPIDPPIEPPLPEAGAPPPLPVSKPAGGATGGDGDTASAVASKSAEAVTTVPAAQEVLGSDEVRPVVLDRDVQVWAAPRLSRRTLLRQGRAPGLYVVCPKGCTIEGSSAILAGKGRTHPRGVALAVTAGQPNALWLAPTRAERRRLRRAKRARARFELSIDGGRPQRYAIAIRR
ncbi:MAG TPA: hypothetical protein VF587_20025, partial [Solirubrobacteraceae bacterium]